MKMQRIIRIGCQALGCALFFGSLVLAQTVTGTLEGLVTDQANAVIPGATVTVRNLETGQERTVKSNAEGFYRAPFLALGGFAHPAPFAQAASGLHKSVF